MTVVNPDLDDHLTSSDTTYSTARSGGGTISTHEGGTTMEVGQTFVSASSKYFCEEGFLNFDTSFLGPNATVLTAILALYFTLEQAGQDFTAEARINAFGPTITTGDWVAGANLGNDTLVAHFLRSNRTLNAYNDFVDDAMVVNISLTSDTKILIASDRLRLGSAPSGFTERITYETLEATNPPKLTIAFLAGGGASAGILLRKLVAKRS